MLISRLGEECERYCARIDRLVPGLWFRELARCVAFETLGRCFPTFPLTIAP